MGKEKKMCFKAAEKNEKKIVEACFVQIAFFCCLSNDEQS